MEDVQKLIDILPSRISNCIADPEELMEIIVDLGRPLETRNLDKSYEVHDVIIDQDDIDQIEESIGAFGLDNRAGLDTTLHRISKIISRTGETVGLTLRIGRVFNSSIEIITDLIEAQKSILLLGSPATGKAQPLYSKISTPDGWKLMGDIQVGDTLHSLTDGFTIVDGVYPQGVKKIKEIVLNDGTSTECTEEHLWVTLKEGDTLFRVRTTEEIEADLERGTIHYLPFIAPVEYPEKKFKTKPYTAGKKVVNRVPHQYLYGSIEQRKEFLRGFQEKHASGNIFYTQSLNIVDSIAHIVRSLGGTTIHSQKNGRYQVSIKLGETFSPMQRRIVAIRDAGEAECQCISVTSDTHIYITDNFIPTHNTTKLREVSRHLSEEGYQVVIVDTSNEIAGEGVVPHPAVGRARRLQVPFTKSQHDVMIEAVENHAPQVVIIDEISTQAEAEAARTIAQRGVILIATAHGRTLDDLIKNSPLQTLIGGVKFVTYGDTVAEEKGLDSKTQRERASDPVFDCIVELINFDEVAIHHNTAFSVDASFAQDGLVQPERRIADENQDKGYREVQPEKIRIRKPGNNSRSRNKHGRK